MNVKIAENKKSPLQKGIS